MSERIIPEGSALSRIDQWLRKVYERNMGEGDDAIVLIIGREGTGKSTLMLQIMLLWRAIVSGKSIYEIDHQQLFQQLYSTRHGYMNGFVQQQKETALGVPDAHRTLLSKEGMVGDQRELEKDFYDVRFQRFLNLLGYQDWEQIPDFLIDGRAHFALFLPNRREKGEIWGFSRASLDERTRVEGRGASKWPEPDLIDRFPSLEGTELWEKYKEYDANEKIARMGGDETPSPEEVQRAEKIKHAIRLVKEFDFSQTNAGRVVGRSQSWVSDREEEYDWGDHDDLFDDPPAVKQ